MAENTHGSHEEGWRGQMGRWVGETMRRGGELTSFRPGSCKQRGLSQFTVAKAHAVLPSLVSSAFSSFPVLPPAQSINRFMVFIEDDITLPAPVPSSLPLLLLPFTAGQHRPLHYWL